MPVFCTLFSIRLLIRQEFQADLFSSLRQLPQHTGALGLRDTRAKRGAGS